MAGQLCGHSGVGIVLNIKVVTLKPINYFVPGLSNIFCIVYIAFEAINEFIALAIGLADGSGSLLSLIRRF